MVVAEDIDFFSHRGFAWDELAKALAEAREQGEMPRGASTITQQLARNLLMAPSAARQQSWRRKAHEAILAYHLTRILSKDEIGYNIFHYQGQSPAFLCPAIKIKIL